MADSMEMMILSILSPALHCAWGLSSWQQALITTVVFCGMMFSSGVWGKVCDQYGRKAELILCSLFTFYFGFLSSFSPTYPWLLILRCLVGFGIGGAPQSIVLYSEFLPQSSRAKCIVMIEIFWALGACFEVVLALLVMPHLGWRWLLGLSSIPLSIFTVCCVWLPESARFDVARGNPESALKTLERIAKENGKPMPLGKLVEPNIKEVKRGRIADLFTPVLRTTTVLLWLIWLANAFSYYGVVLMTTELFQSGESCTVGDGLPEASCSLECKQLTTKDYTDLLWTTSAELPGLLFTVVIIECVGRKKTMTLDFLLFSLFVFLVNICVSREILTSFLFAARAFISGAFQAAYVYTPEVYPTTSRAIGLGSCNGMARIGAIVTPFVAQVMLKHSVHLAISIYGVVCLLAAVASMLLPIETKGRQMKDTHKEVIQ
ncbi:unnamed protein product [Owenia fusiformis]|nr:unnamed protein product [Owenia fusiformis]